MLARALAAALAALCLSTARPAPGAAQGPRDTQRWNDERTMALVRLATERRAQQLADTGLVDYQAVAHGYLTFLAQLGEGFREPPKVVKADELSLQVYWRAPNLSKQMIQGRRDTLLLPTDIEYHRDHLGIVQNNFPSIIRLGDGDEVRDVPHPLSDAGLAEYDFAISDSLTIRLPDRAIEVLQVRVRPRDDRLARVIGAVYIDRDGGQVVRMAFNFTRAAFLDEQLEDLAVILENGLIESRFWLPRRQEIEIRRTGSWLDYPARGIIRGRWEICCYEVNKGLDPRLFRGPEIVQAPPSVRGQHQWQGAILDSLPPDVRAVTAADVKRVQEEARELVRAQALARVRRTSLSARAVSDFLRVNRVEGVAAGAGVTRRLGAGSSVALAGRWGFADERAKGRATFAWERASGVGLGVRLFDDFRDAGDVAERSALVNSLAAQEFGSDYTEPYRARGGALTVELGARLGMLWRLEGGVEDHRALEVHATPANGRYERTIPAVEGRALRGALVLERPTLLAPLGAELSASAELRAVSLRPREGPSERRAVGRVAALVEVERPFGRQRLVLRTAAGAVSAGEVPPQELVYLGGPTSAPGYAFHSLAGRIAASQRVEWQLPVPFVSVPLGRFGQTGRTATLAPFVTAAYVADPPDFQPRRSGWYPAAGLATMMFFDLVRLDVGRGLREGRWTFSADVTRGFWRVL